MQIIYKTSYLLTIEIDYSCRYALGHTVIYLHAYLKIDNAHKEFTRIYSIYGSLNHISWFVSDRLSLIWDYYGHPVGYSGSATYFFNFRKKYKVAKEDVADRFIDAVDDWQVKMLNFKKFSAQFILLLIYMASFYLGQSIMGAPRSNNVVKNLINS